MEQFKIYWKLGIQHITDIYAVDNILILLVLTVIFLLKDWKKALIMLTLLTIGNVLTLTLGVKELFNYNQNLIAYLIPTTIFITSIANLIQKKDNFSIHRSVKRNYIFALIFGLIHGLGYAENLKGILGMENKTFVPLLAVNLGIEIGQMIIVGIFLLLSSIFIGTFNFNRRDWVMVISSAIAGIALTMMFESKFW